MTVTDPLLAVRRVIHETADSRTFELDVPAGLAGAYGGRAGQFLRITLPGDPPELSRCYSLSSAPELGEPLRFTVKRVPGGVVSARLVEALAEGGSLHAGPPAGTFVLRDSARPLLLIAGGSGITPIFSLLKAALATTARPVSLFYANRNAASAIFRDAIDGLARDHAGRFAVRHHFSDQEGLPDAAAIGAFAAAQGAGQVYICGPAPLMDLAEATLAEATLAEATLAEATLAEGGTPACHELFCERFVAPPAAAPEAAVPDVAVPARPAPACSVTFIVEEQEHRLVWDGSGTVLDAALASGIPLPFSCREGHCGACKAKLVAGGVEQKGAVALSRRERERGYVLACCAIPCSPELVLAYD